MPARRMCRGIDSIVSYRARRVEGRLEGAAPLAPERGSSSPQRRENVTVKVILAALVVAALVVPALALAASASESSLRVLGSDRGNNMASPGTKVVAVSRFYVRGYGRNLKALTTVNCVAPFATVVKKWGSITRMQSGRVYPVSMPAGRSGKCNAVVALLGDGGVRGQILG